MLYQSWIMLLWVTHLIILRLFSLNFPIIYFSMNAAPNYTVLMGLRLIWSCLNILHWSNYSVISTRIYYMLLFSLFIQWWVGGFHVISRCVLEITFLFYLLEGWVYCVWSTLHINSFKLCWFLFLQWQFLRLILHILT